MTKKKSKQTAPSPTNYIGIGASAGGLEALQTLLQNLPTDMGACYIVVQHLSPDFNSMMLELLSRHTRMQINNVTDGMPVEPNTIYLIPPKKNMKVEQGKLMLSDKASTSGLNLPIDIFFRSLAEDQQDKAIGIILSGTGSDGSRGIKALKEAGALVIAQEPESAKFDGMPNSAINTGVIDMILRPEEMGEKLESYIHHPLIKGGAKPLRDVVSGKDNVMDEIFNLLKVKSEIDFAKYKPSTVARRIERRMTIKQINSLHEYLALLFKAPYEVQVLSKELLIGVTRFFRDEEAYTNLREQVIPQILSNSQEGEPIRIWVAACSTGEEAYSIAILFHEELTRRRMNRIVKVFATDVNGEAINAASTGIYSEDIQHDIPAKLLANNFNKNSSTTYQVNKSIRQMVIFATHNMIVDPPFSNMDLVSCRNILIYFQHSVQKRVLTSVHFALRNNGYLFLGSSENLSDLAGHFEVINERNKLFRKNGNARLPISGTSAISAQFQASNSSVPSVSRLMRNYRGNSTSNSGISFANEYLISSFAPPCILINDDHEATHVYGDVSNYVKRLPPGKISVDIKDMVNEDISIAVTSAIHRARQSGEEVFYTDVVTHVGGKDININLRAKFLKERDIENAPGYFWLIFEEAEKKNRAAKKSKKVAFNAAEQSRQRIEDLELELKRNKEHLQVTIEELETTNEELQSANEELMSANEELQSTNEELQSVNEELYTVNSEYQEKITEISQANNDLDEVLGLSKIGIIFLDENLLIRRYTQAVSEYINLMETDINRPLHHISQNIQYDNLLHDVSAVFSSGDPKEKEILVAGKAVLRIAIHPYKYSDVTNNKGVAITFSDISHLKYAEKGMEEAHTRLSTSIANALETLDNQSFPEQLDILLVDDQQADLIVIDEYLRKMDSASVSVTTATSVSQATELLASQRFDACIADYQIANDTALELVDAMHEMNIHIPFVVVSGRSEKQTRAKLLAHGILDLVEKNDMTPRRIEQSLRMAIRRNQIDKEVKNLVIE